MTILHSRVGIIVIKFIQMKLYVKKYLEKKMFSPFKSSSIVVIIQVFCVVHEIKYKFILHYTGFNRILLCESSLATL